MAVTGGRVREDVSAVTPSGSWLTRPAVLLKAEGMVVLGLSALLYGMSGGGWGIFALALLAPDLSALGFLAGRRVGRPPTMPSTLIHCRPGSWSSAYSGGAPPFWARRLSGSPTSGWTV